MDKEKKKIKWWQLLLGIILIIVGSIIAGN